jgi:glycosyltransferase involved in cell wall biosynthesis
MKPCRVIFFLTHGSSLRQWDEIGMLDYEISILRALSDGFDQRFIFSYDAADIEVEGFSVIRPPLRMPALFFAVYSMFRHHRLLVHSIYRTNQTHGLLVPLIFRSVFRTSYLVYRSGFLLSFNMAMKWGRFSYQYAYSRCLEVLGLYGSDLIVVSAEWIKDQLAGKNFLVRDKIVVRRNIVGLQFRSSKSHCPKRYDVIFVGRLEREKNLIRLLIICVSLDLRVLIIGNGSQRDLIDHIAARSDGRIEVRKAIDNREILSWIQKSRVFCLPSYYEGSSKALLEALYSGCSVCVSDVIGNREIVDLGFSAKLFDPNDSADLMRALICCVQNEILQSENVALAQRFFELESQISIERQCLWELADFVQD